MALVESKTHYTPEEETHMMLDVPDVPHNLSSKKPIETPVGTWRMDGPYTIFDAHNISIKQEPVPHVKNINEYVSLIIEKEIAAQNPDLTVRRPLGLRRIATLFPTILG